MFAFTRPAHTKWVITLLIVLLCVVSYARGVWVMNNNLHHINEVTISKIDHHFCESHDPCLMVDHEHLDGLPISDSAHFFLHAFDGMEGKIMVGMAAISMVCMVSLPFFFALPASVEPLRGSVFRPPR